MKRFLYCESTSASLRQGDILRATGELREILNCYHRYFASDSYTHFLVLTQNCDLIKRGSCCKARYIAIAPVRPLHVVIQRELEKFQKDRLCVAAKIASNKSRFFLTDFLKKLYNNDNSEYFYLPEIVQNDVYENSCAFLRLSIALKADHYDECLKARRVSMTDVFRANLGWTVGNLYSRVGTPDWVPDCVTKAEFEEQINKELDSHCLWLDDESIQDIKKYLKKNKDYERIVSLDFENAREAINKIEYETKADKIIKRITEKLIKIDPAINSDTISALENSLKSDARFTTFFRTSETSE